MSRPRLTRPSSPTDHEISYLDTGTSIYELALGRETGLDFIFRPDLRFQRSPTAEMYSPVGWLLGLAQSGVVLLPSAAEIYGDINRLADEIRDFIHRYFDCPPQFESVATLYILMTWVTEPFHNVPYLRFLGVSGTGKTRASEVIGSLCYRRLMIAGAATAPPMFRMMEVIGGTLVIDEADFSNSVVGSEIAKVLNCGYQRGTPVIRMEKIGTPARFEPRMYDVFGPKIINGRARLQDDATESRCLTLVPRETQRTDMPLQLPTAFHDEALTLRNKLLQFRFDFIVRLVSADRPIPGMSRRMNQIITPLILIAEELEDPTFNEHLLAFASDTEAQNRQDRGDSLEAALVRAFVQLADKKPTCGTVLARIKADLGEEDPDVRKVGPRKVSDIARTLGFQTHRTNRGSVLKIDAQRLSGLCARFSIDQHAPQSDAEVTQE